MLVSPFPSPVVSPFTPLHPTMVKPKPADPVNPELSLPRHVSYLADYGGCGHWRVLWPEQIMNATGAGISTSLSSCVYQKAWYMGLKSVKLQRQAGTDQVEFAKFLKSIQKECGFKMIYEVDDVVFSEDIPDYNAFKFAFVDPKIRQNTIDIINLCDEVTVPSEFMKKLYIERTGKKEITVVPNFPPAFWLGRYYNPQKVYRAFEKNKSKPRILYSGSGSHYDTTGESGGKDDFEEIIKFVLETIDTYQWVFMGAFPPVLAPLIKSGKIEFHEWKNIIDYPLAISQLDVQLSIAPLQDNNFNRAKSDIKFIEAATLGIPCLCQDMCTYASAPAELRFHGIEEFRQKVTAILKWKNKKNYFANVSKLHNIGAKRALENPQNIGCHTEVLNTPYGDKSRKFLAKWN